MCRCNNNANNYSKRRRWRRRRPLCSLRWYMCAILILFQTIILPVVVVVVDAQYLARAQCNINEMPVVLLYRDPTSGNFTFVQRLGISTSPNNARFTNGNNNNNNTSGDVAEFWRTPESIIDTVPGATSNQFRLLQATDYVGDDRDSSSSRSSTLISTTKTTVESPTLRATARYYNYNDNDDGMTNYWPSLKLSNGGYDGRSLTQAFNSSSNGSSSRNNTTKATANIDSIIDDFLNSNNISNNDNNFTANNNNNTDNNNNHNFFIARECGCFVPRNPVVYCPFAIDSCLIHLQVGTPPGCRNVADESAFAYSFNLITLSWFGVLALCLVLPVGTGAYFRDYLISCCYPKWTEKVADRILTNNPARARVLIRSYYIHRQAVIQRAIERRRQEEGDSSTDGTSTAAAAPTAQNDNNDGNENHNSTTQNNQAVDDGDGDDVAAPATSMNSSRTKRPTMLALKVTTYHDQQQQQQQKEKQQQQQDEEQYGMSTMDCAICFSPLQDGDRVGSLSCDHIFHIHCLKTWLQRKNVCPLCQQHDIAEPRYDEPPPAISDSNDDDETKRDRNDDENGEDNHEVERGTVQNDAEDRYNDDGGGGTEMTPRQTRQSSTATTTDTDTEASQQDG